MAANVGDALKQITVTCNSGSSPTSRGGSSAKPFVSGASSWPRARSSSRGRDKGRRGIGGAARSERCYIRENVIIGSGCSWWEIRASSRNSIVSTRPRCRISIRRTTSSAPGAPRRGRDFSNVKLDRGEITASHGEKVVPTGLQKIRSDIGDHAEIELQLGDSDPGSLNRPPHDFFTGH